MVNRKSIRKRGKLSLSRLFQNFERGDRAKIVAEASISGNFPKELQGRTGTIEGKRGKAYIVKIKDNKKEKNFLIEPIHLKK